MARAFTHSARDFIRRPAPWDIDVEADWHSAARTGRSLNAYAIAAEGGYTFPCATLKPRASVGVDLASGSADGTHRFNQLFPPQYLYLGHMYVLGRENVIDVHPEFSLGLPHDVTLYAAEHIFWRQNTNDAAYNLNGGRKSAPRALPVPPRSATNSTSTSPGKSSATSFGTLATPTSSPARSSRKPGSIRTWISHIPR